MSKPSDTHSSAISPGLIAILTKECARAHSVCSTLSSNTDFKSAVAMIVGTPDTNYKVQHLLLRDIIKVFNKLTAAYNNTTHIPATAKFILIYLYEYFRGIDLIESLGTQKINLLTSSNRFDQNVKVVRETTFPAFEGDLQEEFIMPVILRRINSENLPGIVAFLNRIAALIAKADDTITEEEELILKSIADKANHPAFKPATSAQYAKVPENDSLEIVLQELHELIGMGNIKQSIEDLTNFLKVQNIRREKGLKTTVNSLHSVFMGPPGTGKTTVARLLGRLYKHLGYLEKGHLVETDRAGMVAGYVGQTAIKTEEIIKSAVGGVLFIDEAYSLTSGHYNDFGGEAVEILLKRMEDQRGELVVVVAGYPDEMEEFILSNPGLQSRFNRYFTFDHFSVDDLLKIFKLNAKKADFILSEEAEEKLTEILERIYEKRHKGFGNARTVRNLFEKIIERQANRIIALTPITEDMLKTLTDDDVPDILKTVKEIVALDEED